MVMRLPSRTDIASRCRAPEHKPPNLASFTPGMYSHTCPTCGKVTWFTVELPEYGSVSADTY